MLPCHSRDSFADIMPAGCRAHHSWGRSQSASTGYAYDPSSKRLQTITINGVTITYAYLPDSNQLQSITVGDVTTTLTPYSTDGSLLGGMTVTAAGQTAYNASYTYNADQQRATDTVTSTSVDDSGNTTSVNASKSYTYNPTEGDSLVSVQNASGTTIENYGYDAAGNLTSANGNVQTANNVNQLSGYAVNARGDVTTTANYSIQWDALDRPIEITPRNPVVGSYQIKLGYDSQNRWLWKDVSQWTGSAWVYAYTRNAVWDGSNLTAVTDQNGNLVQTYTWGPSGLTLITDYSSGEPISYVPIADASGNTAMVINAVTGAVVASYTYDAYGNVLTASGPMKGLCPFLGKGLYVHSEVPGLMFAQNRVTDGRIWLSRDPSGESSDSNLYQLYDGDPINGSDPTGLYEVDFHYYVVYFLLRARGWSASDSDSIAGWSQFVDDDPISNPEALGKRALFGISENKQLAQDTLRDYHFPGSSPTQGTRPGDRTTANSVSGAFAGGNPIVIGRWLHTYADTWAHNGFGAYFSDVNEVVGLPIFNIGHAQAFHDPDRPYLDVMKALNAARDL